MDELKGLRLYVTNPCFEFWLLLHFEEFQSKMPGYNEEDLRRNPIDPDSKKRLTERFIDGIMCDIYGEGYSKAELHFEERLLPRIGNAMEYIESYAEDLQSLNDHLGSNIRKFLLDVGCKPEPDSKHTYTNVAYRE